MAQTTDGWTISLVEPHGQSVGETLGNVWLKSPRPRTNPWYRYPFQSVAMAQAAAQLAEQMTQDEFAGWADIARELHAL